MSEIRVDLFVGPTERVFIGYSQSQRKYVVRPPLVTVDGNQIRFRNFTEHEVTISDAAFLDSSFTIPPRGKVTVPLRAGIAGDLYEYRVTVSVGGVPEEAIGHSRPQVIIDR